jgi:hypothetical protein
VCVSFLQAAQKVVPSKYGNYVLKVSSIKMGEKVFLTEKHTHGHFEAWTRYSI